MVKGNKSIDGNLPNLGGPMIQEAPYKDNNMPKDMKRRVANDARKAAEKEAKKSAAKAAKK
jgi:uncharacterized protein (UPF0147 family)